MTWVTSAVQKKDCEDINPSTCQSILVGQAAYNSRKTSLRLIRFFFPNINVFSVSMHHHCPGPKPMLPNACFFVLFNPKVRRIQDHSRLWFSWYLTGMRVRVYTCIYTCTHTHTHNGAAVSVPMDDLIKASRGDA